MVVVIFFVFFLFIFFRKVSISVPSSENEPHLKIKRRQTGFVRPEDLEKIRIYKSESDMSDDESAVDMSRYLFLMQPHQIFFCYKVVPKTFLNFF